MNGTIPHDPGRIDFDHREPSPSTGWRETAVILGATNAHAVEPVDAHGCTALDCTADQDLRRVTRDDGTRRILCPTHTRDFLDQEGAA